MRPHEAEQRGLYHMHVPTIAVALSGTERPVSPEVAASRATSHLFPRYPTPSPPSQKKPGYRSGSEIPAGSSSPDGSWLLSRPQDQSGALTGWLASEEAVSTKPQLDIGTAGMTGQQNLQQSQWAEMGGAVSFGSLSSVAGGGNSNGGSGWRPTDDRGGLVAVLHGGSGKMIPVSSGGWVSHSKMGSGALLVRPRTESSLFRPVVKRSEAVW